jgi:heme-degrading monooxygenase HmoA
MYIVIFKAVTAVLDEEYAKTIDSMRRLAFEQYGCLDFVAVTEGQQEIALSYWKDQASILAWKSDAQHQIAQQLGRANWYQSYTVEIAEIKRHYAFHSESHASSLHQQ